jgi:hypothetical protein
MARFENTTGPFGTEANHCTYGEIQCGFCRKTYHKDGESDESIVIHHFGDLQVLDCCFEKLEQAVLEHMQDILPWYARLLRKRQEVLDKHRGMLRELTLLPELQSRGGSESS